MKTKPKIKEHKQYPGMFFYKQTNGRWSTDFFNLTRAKWYSLEEFNITDARLILKGPVLPHK